MDIEKFKNFKKGDNYVVTIEELENVLKAESKVKNRGTGAGGKKTNKNGLAFEAKKDLSSEYKVIVVHKRSHKVIEFKNHEGIHVDTGTKHQFIKYLDKYEDEFFKDKRLAGTIQPDKWFVINSTIIILELKFQQGGGSVIEKLQTATIKIEHFQKRYPGKKIVYIYGLHEWFRDNAKAEIYNLKKKNIPIFWGDSNTFKQDIVDYIISCK